MSLSKLSTVPDLALLRIFYHLPLEDLLSRVNLVCRRWAQMKGEACAQRRHLFLLIGDDNFQRKSLLHDAFTIPFPHQHTNYQIKSKWSRLEFADLSPENLDQFAVQLPNIVSLILIHKETGADNLLSQQLLNIWSSKLVSLKILFPLTTSPITEDSDEFALLLLETINSPQQLPNLKHLTFIYNSNFGRVDDTYELNLEIFSQLDEVCFRFDENSVWKSLQEQDNDGLKRIALFDYPTKDDKLTSVDKGLAAKLTMLSFDSFPQFVNLDEFPNVTTVLLTKFGYTYKIPISHYFRHLLSHFPRLSHLSIYIDVELFLKDNLPTTSSDIQLTSVKVLSLDLFNYSRSHSEMNRVFSLISKFVPAIRVLTIRMHNFGCKDCDISQQEDIANIPYDQFTNCVRESLHPLKRYRDRLLHRPLDRIETIYSKRAFYREWTVEDL